jgi:electron transfer flavoprotein beta subunit
LRLNEPRYISLPNIVQAKRKSIAVIPLPDLGLDTKSRLQVLTVTSPAARRGGIKVGSMAELVDKLKNEARVLS